MRRLTMMALAGALAAPLPLLAQAEPSGPPGYKCSATVRELGGETVSVSVSLDPGGILIDSTASWRPPEQSDMGRSDLSRPDVTLWINYDVPAPAAIGQPVEAELSVSVFSPPRDRVAPGKLIARLGGLTGRYRFGDGPFVPMSAFAKIADAELPGMAEATLTVPLPDPLPPLLEVQVLDAKGRVVTASRFDLSAAKSRAAIFAQAYAQAEAARADFKSCAPLGE